MTIKTKKRKIHIGRILLSVLFVLGLSIICKGGLIGNIETMDAKAESSNSNVVMENWNYFCNLEETYRSQNPNVTYEEMTAYLETKIAEVEEGDVIVPTDVIIGGINFTELYESLTSAERE